MPKQKHDYNYGFSGAHAASTAAAAAAFPHSNVSGSFLTCHGLLSRSKHSNALRADATSDSVYVIFALFCFVFFGRIQSSRSQCSRWLHIEVHAFSPNALLAIVVWSMYVYELSAIQIVSTNNNYVILVGITHFAITAHARILAFLFVCADSERERLFKMPSASIWLPFAQSYNVCSLVMPAAAATDTANWFQTLKSSLCLSPLCSSDSFECTDYAHLFCLCSILTQRG